MGYMSTKQQLGQFFTKNTGYILSGLENYVAGKQIIDPFAGAGDLLDWALQNGAESILGLDIDKKWEDNKRVFYNDSLTSPKNYHFVLTNPPYLYQNKMQDNSLLVNSKHTDLYQLSLEKIESSEEGIVIVPVNFLSSENARYIRKSFLDKFEIVQCNYFTEQVFADTTYNVIAFYYRQKKKPSQNMVMDFRIFPENRKTKIEVFRKFNWQIGGEFLAEIKRYENKLRIARLEEDDLQSGKHRIRAAYNHLDTVKEFHVSGEVLQLIKRNIILLKAIDTGTMEGKICLEDIRKYGLDALVSIKTSRNQISLVFPDEVTVAEQEQLIELFNRELETQRQKYYSLFMTNFRDNDRKRISFNFAYHLINYLYYSKIKTDYAQTKSALF
ncbi:hypothetical protein FACS189427_11160 [Planctomycetales bacterium]|nr:hypothetical protein FACS189427_11160 [Planctomycetales bacterium]